MNAGRHINIGKLGENMAVEYLIRIKYEIICRNYLKKWGEIDIIGEKSGVITFFEVKTVTRSYICNKSDQYRAEDNVHPYKVQRLKRVIQTYLAGVRREVNWQFDLIIVSLKKSDLSLITVDHLNDIII